MGSVDLDNMKLPSVNERRQLSNTQRQRLNREIRDTINRLQAESGYVFEQYEVDEVLLDLVKSSQESYIVKKFGNNQIG
jgi:hypothetical protein